MLDVLFRHASEAITVQDREGRVVYANPRAMALTGFPAGTGMVDADGGAIVAKFELIDGAGKPLDPAELPGRQVLEGRATFAEKVIGYRARNHDRHVRWSQVRASPIKDDAGRVVWAINFFLDITERVERERSEKLVAGLHESLSSSLDVRSVADALADVVVPGITDWAAVHILDDGGFLQVMALRHPQTEAAKELFEDVNQQRLPLTSDHMPGRVVASGRPEVRMTMTGDVSNRAESIMGPMREVLERLDVKSVACLPLRAADRTVGTLTVARSGAQEPLDSPTVSLLSTVTERAGVALANALLVAHERELARFVTRSLEPPDIPDLPGLAVSVRYRPQALISKVGGDFYDVIRLSEDRCAIFVGDIEGKGTSAAGLVATARQTLRATIESDPNATTVFRRLNAALLSEVPARLCTLAYILIERIGEKAEIEVSLAGHPPPLKVSADGSATELGRPSPPAGVMASLEPFRDRATLGSGDIVIAYTDGVLAADDASGDGLKAHLAGLAFSSLEDLLDGLVEAAEGPGFRDDVVLLGIRVV